MKLYFLRHGEAASADGRTIKSDYERPLTKDGIEIMKSEGKALTRLNVDPEIIWTSPLVRARETAEIVAKQLGASDKLVETPKLQCGARLDEIRDLLNEK